MVLWRIVRITPCDRPHMLFESYDFSQAYSKLEELFKKRCGELIHHERCCDLSVGALQPNERSIILSLIRTMGLDRLPEGRKPGYALTVIEGWEIWPLLRDGLGDPEVIALVLFVEEEEVERICGRGLVR